MSDCLSLKESNCKNCYKCIRHCPVKSISFISDEADIINDECILCGECYVICPQSAKEIRNDLPVARKLLASSAPVYASVAPSFLAGFKNTTISSLRRALEKLGFAGTEETAVGATIIKNLYDKMTYDVNRDVIISSCCHSVILLIQKHFPAAIPYIADVMSPMLAHSHDIKRRIPDAKTVFIGPCISKKDEADKYNGITDCVLTFSELSEWFDEEGIELEHIPDDTQTAEMSRARLFPTTGGIIKTMSVENPEYTYMAIDGVDNCIHTIKDILNGNIKKCFIEMSACVGSCIGGPIIDKTSHLPASDYISITKYAGKKDFDVIDYNTEELTMFIPSLSPNKARFNDRAIADVLRKIGKTKPEHELNCGSCGYDTCRDKALAVLRGKANLTMCLPYLKEKAESFSDHIIKNTPNGIIVLNEGLEVQQINDAACRIINIKDARDVINEQVVRILDPTPFVEVMTKNISSREKRVYLAEYGKYVEQTVLYDKSYHIIICLMRDITEEEKNRESKEAFSRSTIDVADKVIEKQMRVVQEIASLLGETTAETKVALTKLKESLNNE